MNSASCPQINVIRAYHRLPPEPGGMEQHIARLTAEQRRSGVEVFAVFNTGQDRGASLRVAARWPLAKLKPAAIRNLIFYGSLLFAAGRVPVRSNTILHVHGAWSDFLLAKLVARCLGIRNLVATVHGKVQSKHLSLYSFGLSRFDVVYTTGKREERLLELILKRDVVHIPSPPGDIFFDTKQNAEKLWDVVTVGSLVQVKNLELFLNCAKLRPNLRFAVFGDGPLRARLEMQIQNQGLQNVALLGRKSQAEIADALASSRVFMSTSVEEGTPTSMLEAMAAGLPVLTSPSNDYDWLITQGHEGLVTDGWEPGEFASKLDKLLGDEPGLLAMGRAGQQKVRQYTWPATASRVTGAMRDLVK